MSSNNAFQARGNLSRTLTYRPHLRASYYGLLAFSAIGALTVLGLALAAYVNDNPSLALMVGMGGALAPLVLLIEAHFFVRPLAFVKIKVHQHGLTMESPDKTVEVPFADVVAIKFSHLPYVGGWFKLVMKSGENHRFTVVLERSEYILEMMAALKPEMVNTEEMMHYRRTAVLADHSWGRVSEKLKNKTGLLLKYFVLPVLLTGLCAAGLVYYGQQEVPGMGHLAKIFILMISMNLAVSFLVTFSVAEFLIVTHGRDQLLADPTNMKRDYVFEKRMERWGHAGHWVIAIGMLIFALLRYQY